MLRLILGEDWIANRDWVLGDLARQVREKRGNQILLVPELISHDAERRLCQAAGDTASRYAEVLSFTRLIRRVSEYEQQVPRDCLDGGGRLIAMAAAARALTSKLKSYAAVDTRPEFLTELLDAVDEFKRGCITPEDLQEASEKTQGSLAQKLSELSLLLASYDAVCARGKQDPRDQMDWLLEQLEEGSFAQNHCFYIDGFPDLTRQHMEILKHLLVYSPMVTVSLNCDRVRSGQMAFEKAGKTAEELVNTANELGISVEKILVDGRSDGLLPMRRRLFQGRLEPARDLEQRLRLLRTDTVFDECLVAAEQIMELVADGCRYRDIGVVCANPEQYRGILSLVCKRCGIPVYLSGTDDILEKTAIATVLSALDAAMDGMEQSEVLRYLKSLLSPVDTDTCDLLENYVKLWGIRGEKWNQEWTLHPQGLGKDWHDRDRELLERLNQARRLGVGPLIRLRNGLQGAENLGRQVESLSQFLEEIHLAEGLEQLAQEAEEGENPRMAQEAHQLWEILLGAMEQLQGMLGEIHWEPQTFSRLMKLLLSQYDVGTIPTVLDAVTVGPVSAMRLQQVRHLLVLGAAEGNLPGYGGSKGLLSDQERTELRRLGVTLTGGAMEGVESEFAEIYGCFCGATESVTVSCPAGQTAFVYRRLCALTGRPDGVSMTPGPGPGLHDRWEAGAYLARWKQTELARRLQVSEGCQEAMRRAQYDLGQVGPEQIQALYGRRLTLSASQIDLQSGCRLAYFLHYGLGLREQREITVDAMEFGTFVHEVLEYTVREVMELGGFHQVDLEKTLEIAGKNAEKSAVERFGVLDSDRLTYLMERNRQELHGVVEELWQELSQSKFEPFACELGFGRGEKMPGIPISGQRMQAVLEGRVDRIDRYETPQQTFFRVVDYKTGKKSFDYCDVFNGVGLQMLLYLFALEQNGAGLLGQRPVGAGVQYFPARMPYLSENSRLEPQEAAQEHLKEMKRRGLILEEPEILQAMDPQEGLPRLPVRIKKDGTVTGDVADREQFHQLRQYLTGLLGRKIDEIARGEVSPNPYTRGPMQSACSFCPYGAVCARQREQGRRNYKTMTAQRFWEELDKEVGSHGGNADG